MIYGRLRVLSACWQMECGVGIAGYAGRAPWDVEPRGIKRGRLKGVILPSAGRGVSIR